MPDTIVETVAGDVTGGLVILPSIERLSLVGPHFLSVIARKHGPVARSLGIGTSHQRRTIFGTGSIAHRLAAGILVKSVECHSFAIHQGLALGCVAGFCG